MSVFDRITSEVHAGLQLKTPSLNKPFTVKAVEADRVVFFIKTMEIAVSKDSWNGLPDFLKDKSWVKIGAKHEASPYVDDFTLEKYLRKTTESKSKHSQASYVAPLLEYLRIVQVDRDRPTKIRLIQK